LSPARVSDDELDIVVIGDQDMRIERATAVQLGSRERADINHPPDGPQQRGRDARFAGQDPLRHNEWLYGYDAEEAVMGA
jgi:salicylate hydroxylase